MLSKLRNALAALLPQRGAGVDHWLEQLEDDDARRRWQAAGALRPHSGQDRVISALVDALGELIDGAPWVPIEVSRWLKHAHRARHVRALARRQP